METYGRGGSKLAVKWPNMVLCVISPASTGFPLHYTLWIHEEQPVLNVATQAQPLPGFSVRVKH